MKDILIFSKLNNARCQMLEAWLNYYGKGEVRVLSVGVEPVDKVDIFALKSMMEAVIDISSQKTKGLDAIKQAEFDYLFLFDESLMQHIPATIFYKEKIVLEMNNPLSMDLNETEKLKEFGLVRDIIEDYTLDFVNDNIKKIF